MQIRIFDFTIRQNRVVNRSALMRFAGISADWTRAPLAPIVINDPVAGRIANGYRVTSS
jgi:hypothetical protein